VTRARAALLLMALVVALAAHPASAQGTAASQAFLFIVDKISFEELLSLRGFRELARAGGASLMTTHVPGVPSARLRYETLGAGAQIPGGTPRLMATVLRSHGIAVCPTEPIELVGERVDWLIGVGPESEACNKRTRGNSLVVVDAEEVFRNLIQEAPRREVLETLGDLLLDGFVLGDDVNPATRLLVIVVAPQPSAAMDRLGDEVTPILLAEGTPSELRRRSRAMYSLTSDSTREDGLVSNVDVAPTILDFFGIPMPSEMDGQPIRITDAPAPFHLHQLHLDQRRIRFPIQLAEVAFVAASGAVAIVVLLVPARRRRLPARVAGIMRFVALCGVALPIPLMLGGSLPRLTYWVVVPFLVFAVVALATLARFARWPGSLGPFVFLGLVGLAVVVLDAMLGWRGARIPLIGGTMFDGARFYGLPNAFLGLVLASALFVAAALPAFIGFLVLVGVGLFVGFPSLGADIGGALTLFFAAGLWWVLRTRHGFGLKELAFVVGVTVLGLGAVLLANRYLPGTPTHATRFVERTGSHLGTAIHRAAERLRVGVDQVRKVPAAGIPLLGLPIVLGLVLTRPGPIGWGLVIAGRRWQQALIVLTLAGMVAFIANDTGVAAAAPVFLYAMSGTAYPAFLASSSAARTSGEDP
jgi:hypothetical protein